eukprot:757062-Rhodomonas_salina.1
MYGSMTGMNMTEICGSMAVLFQISCERWFDFGGKWQPNMGALPAKMEVNLRPVACLPYQLRPELVSQYDNQYRTCRSSRVGPYHLVWSHSTGDSGTEKAGATRCPVQKQHPPRQKK